MKILRFIKSIITISILLVGIGGGFYAWRALSTNQTIERLLIENTELRQAITRLSEETQIGYAKVLSQETREGRLFTKLLFVETRPHEPLQPISKKEYEIQGNIVHFDALIVKFDAQLVMDGKERALYLWRRIYSEHLAPESGPVINVQGMEPVRYQHLCQKLSLSEKKLFWENIWELANDPNRLASLGVRAVYGNAVYHRLEPGLIYVFKIDSTGSVYPEVVPDL